MIALTSEPRNAHLVCELLYRALKREEDDIRQIGVNDARIDHFLCSLAFAPELVVGYLLRKEALRNGIPVECERNFNDGGIVDVCFIQDGKYTALCEIKGPWGIWRTDGIRLRKDVQKVLTQKFSDASSAKRYNAWILVAENETTPDLKQWVEKIVGGIAEMDECEVSLPISVNRIADQVSVWNGKPHECLRVVVFGVRR
jgi:hypothetical protein